jgi:hypothetical protein
MLVFMIYSMVTIGATANKPAHNEVLYVGHVHHVEDVTAAEENMQKLFEGKGYSVVGFKYVESVEI